MMLSFKIPFYGNFDFSKTCNQIGYLQFFLNFQRIERYFSKVFKFNCPLANTQSVFLSLTFSQYHTVQFFFLLFFREKFLLGKRCRFHCSWKLVALSLTVLTLILSSVIAYFGGMLILLLLICILILYMHYYTQ